MLRKLLALQLIKWYAPATDERCNVKQNTISPLANGCGSVFSTFVAHSTTFLQSITQSLSTISPTRHEADLLKALSSWHCPSYQHQRFRVSEGQHVLMVALHAEIRPL